MRDIIFKAKRVDNGVWVEGYLFCRKYSGSNEIFEAHIIQDAYEQLGIQNFGMHPVLISPVTVDETDGCYRVDINTICQYTGLTDTNGNKIFENDILEWKFMIDDSNYYECVWLEDECAFAFKCGNDYTNPVDCYTDDDHFCMSVISNIFDNPET